ncbi:MAG: DNA polymerase Y family protein, partial [Pseudomonadota bacterium]
MPGLTFESHVALADRAGQFAVIEECKGQRLVKAVNVAGERRGLSAGMTLTAALALVPELSTRLFEPRRLCQALETLAQTAEEYTALVALRPPDTLLLEIGASLRLFGGLAALSGRIARDVRALGHQVTYAVAPAPSAAAWLSVWRPGSTAASAAGLARLLRDLPIDSAGWPHRLQRRLHATGVRTLGQCRRLPRAGFAKRFGPGPLLDLDRAYGDSPEPVRPWRSAPVFRSAVELHGEIDATALLQEACDVLFERLAAYLRRRQAAVRAILLRFYPLTGKATALSLRLHGAGSDQQRWRTLLSLKLDALTFEAPAVLVELESRAIETATTTTTPLALAEDAGKPVDAETHGLFVERLRTRLGVAAVRSLRLAADQRPECAMVYANPLGDLRISAPTSPRFELDVTGGTCVLQRPLWLLSQPELLGTVDTLTLKSGPERIETGWWDGRD